MAVRYHTTARVGLVQTTDGSTSTVVSYDLVDATQALGAFANCQVYAELRLLGRTASPDYLRFDRGLSFAIESGTVAQLDLAAIVLGTDFISAALAGAAPVLDFTGTTIRGRGTGVVAQTINWTGYLWLYSTSH